MDPTLISTLLTTLGIPLGADMASAVGAYASGLSSPTEALGIFQAIYSATGNDTAATVTVLKDGASCVGKLQTWFAASKLSTAVQQTVDSSGNICDWIDLSGGQPNVVPGSGSGTGGYSNAQPWSQSDIDAILAQLPGAPAGVPDPATSLGGLQNEIAIISTIVAAACGGTTRSSCNAANKILYDAAGYPDLLEWAYDNGSLQAAAQAAADTYNAGPSVYTTLPDIIKQQQKTAGGSGAPGTSSASSSGGSGGAMVAAAVGVGLLAIAGIVAYNASHKRGRVSRSGYVHV